MRTVSTGAGLCVLGACVLGAAALSSPKLGNAASAADSGKQVSSSSPLAFIPSKQTSTPQVPHVREAFIREATTSPAQSGGAASGSACQELEPHIWFTTVHPYNLCLDSNTGAERGFGVLNGLSHDFNDDGKVEFLSGPDLPNGLLASTPPETVILSRDLIDFDGTTTSFRAHPVMTAAPLLAFIQSQPDLPADWGFYPWSTFRDMDNDGDLDAVITLIGSLKYHFVWVENTGFQSSAQSNPYDHDGDGSVNTGDLSLLLLNFD
jgi:hypothetical protein